MKNSINLVIHNSNTYGFRKKLIKLGIKPHPTGFFSEDKNLDLYIFDGFFANKQINMQEKLIDCRDIQDLVIEIIKRDESTDKNQLFIFDNTDVDNIYGERCVYRCKNKDISVDLAYDMLFTFCTKASIDDIIRYYFSNKEEI